MTAHLRARERGQATVELALVAPLVVVMAIVLGQVALVARDRVLVTHAAREAARVAVVGADPGAVREAVVRSSGLDPRHLRVATSRRGGLVTVIISYRRAVNVPFLGRPSGKILLKEQVIGYAED